jgi:hypothetical protein
MNINWDGFPVNIAETAGSIHREPFAFQYKRFEVWHLGKCIHQGNSIGTIQAKVYNKYLDVTIDDFFLKDFIIDSFCFGEISTLHDRIMWSKDIFDRIGKKERNNPDVSSLFYLNGELVKVTFTIDDPNTLVDFYSEE